jgi:glyoxylase-like metal-dependent hydrolase (beta-lactamase superfamily II)
MNIRVLGCSGAIAAGYKTTAFLLDDDVLIDAGTGVGDLPLDALATIDHILLTHSHLDHVLGIPLLADAVLRLRVAAGRPPIQVHALPETLDALRLHIFNGAIWPDFTRLPSREAPALSLHPFQIGDRLDIGGRVIEVLPAAHTVPAVGFAVDGGDKAGHAHWVFTGDTGPNPALWRRLAQLRLTQWAWPTSSSRRPSATTRLNWPTSASTSVLRTSARNSRS